MKGECLCPDMAIQMGPKLLRGPAAILFISRDTCSDSIAKRFRACFYGVSHEYGVIRCQMGYRTDVSVGNQVPRGGIAPFWGSADLLKKRYGVSQR